MFNRILLCKSYIWTKVLGLQCQSQIPGNILYQCQNRKYWDVWQPREGPKCCWTRRGVCGKTRKHSPNCFCSCCISKRLKKEWVWRKIVKKYAKSLARFICLTVSLLWKHRCFAVLLSKYGCHKKAYVQKFMQCLLQSALVWHVLENWPYFVLAKIWILTREYAVCLLSQSAMFFPAANYF